MSLENLTLEELKAKRPDLVTAIQKEADETRAKEYEDLSGPWNPDLRHEDLSKEFLLKIMNIWQYAWITLSGTWYEEVRKRYGMDVANECELAAWVNMGEKVNPRYARMAKIELNTVFDCMKALQLPLDNIMRGGLFDGRFDVRGPNEIHVIYDRCVALEGLERNWPERIVPLCHGLEKKMIEVYALHPKFEAVPIKLPNGPRENKEDIACEWIFRLRED